MSTSTPYEHEARPRFRFPLDFGESPAQRPSRPTGRRLRGGGWLPAGELERPEPAPMPIWEFGLRARGSYRP